MLLRNSRYWELAEKIKNNKSRVIIYGAGMIGQIVVPYVINQYGLHEYVECYMDMDKRKTGQKIRIAQWQYEIRQPDFGAEKVENLIILVTNSKFYPVIDYLDGMEELSRAEVYIIPIMQIYEMQFQPPVSVERVSDTPLIPKKIHYCWFGRKEMPDFLEKCVETWRKFCPEYEIIRWNEDNYDVNKIPYVREAYENKKYGFVTDVARLDILYEHGGIYMDTDVSLLKGLDDFLYQEAFVGVEKWGNINSGGGIGAISRHPMIAEMLEYRCRFHFLLEDGSVNIETNGLYETRPFLEHGMRVDNTLQVVNNVTVYPSGVFHPYDYMSCEEQVEDWTHAKHHFYGGWMDCSDLNNRSNTQQKYQQIMQRMRVD